MITHSELVALLVKPGKDIINELTPEKTSLLHMVIGISGESGELLDAIKKHVIYGKPLDRGNALEEMGDIEFYMEGIRQILGFTREEIIQHNINKLSKRYAGLKYSNEKAIERADKRDTGETSNDAGAS